MHRTIDPSGLQEDAAVATPPASIPWMELTLWVCAGILAVGVIPEADSGNPFGLACFGVLNALLGVRVFWVHGDTRITGPGLYGLASAVFTGFAALYWSRTVDAAWGGIQHAAVASYWTLLAMWVLFWRQSPSRSDRPVVAPPLRVTNWLFLIGFVLNATASVLWLREVRLGSTLLQEVAFSGMALIMTAMVLHGRREGSRWFLRLALAGLGVIAFYQTTFTGYGRLILVALALIPVVIIAARQRTRTVKVLMLLGIAPALALLSLIRERFGQRTYGQELSGIGSVVDPLRMFGRLIEGLPVGHFDLAHGETFWSAFVVWVPRSYWSGKPVGFGSELTRIFEPQLLAVGQSLAALNAGEWFYNFGWLGVVAMVPVVGWGLRYLDHVFLKSVQQPLSTKSQALVLVLVTLLVVDIPNMMWGGTFAYVARTLFRVGTLVILLILVTGPRERHGASRRRSDPRVRRRARSST